MIHISGLLAWLYQNCAGNLVASAIAFSVGYVWKIRPHIKRHNESLTALHDKVDDLMFPVSVYPSIGTEDV